MGSLVMSFLGICMNVTKGLPAGVKHRVVALDLSEWTQTQKYGALPPHHCYVEFHDLLAKVGTKASWSRMMFDGWHLTVANATGSFSIDLDVHPTPPAPFLTKVPSLTEYAPDMNIRLDLLQEGPPDQAASFVDISHGSVTAHIFPEGGVYTTWAVETEGDPELVLTPRAGRAIRVIVPSTPEGAHLPSGTPGSLAFQNSTTDAEDKKYDFVLHYLAAVGGIPPDLGHFPQDPSAIPKPDFGLTTSCSNSQYP